MKNTKNILAAAMIAMTITTYANATSTIVVNEDKATVSTIGKALPESVPTLETPAPQKAIVTKNDNYTAPQKANIVELKLKSDSKK
ncbi:hypothetical protein [Dyadobacter frigoris]|uniref:hypothetical protein n=1 Tax=Dyadobacter frigoris TaxID=2576211 RepID=UPI0014853219|nr:hypothetical protein [Dyadobacter frigoris]GLU51662.1 hypothetical protein Dfri01_11230 [Dyadobacter frigoris]